MRSFALVVLITNILACTPVSDTQKDQDLGWTVAEREAARQAVQDSANTAREEKANSVEDKYEYMDSSIIEDIKRLEESHVAAPFYVLLDDRRYFIVSTDKQRYPSDRFAGKFKYGIVDDSLNIVLETEYDKVYNPNLTLQGCFEIKEGPLVGLVNYQSKEVLAPQFEFIMPSGPEVTDVAYGYKNSTWFQINSTDLSTVEETEFSPGDVLKTLDYDVQKLGGNTMYGSYETFHPDDPGEGFAVAINPSYIEYFNLMPKEYYTDVILEESNSTWGTDKGTLVKNEQKSLTETLEAYLYSVYESGVDARGYYQESSELVIHNTETNGIQAVQLNSLNTQDQLCREKNYTIVNDSIIEVWSSQNDFGTYEEHYSFQTTYSYRKILRNGEIVELNSDRKYDFTKYVYINEDHFKGCFARYFNDEERKQNENANMFRSDHLSIEDLDIMRNEIFAEYGYIFKNEEWYTYFSGKPWYKPSFENVDDQLTEIDKANIEIILEVKKSMEGHEQEFTNKRPIEFSAAG